MHKLATGLASALALLLCAPPTMATASVKSPVVGKLPSGPAWIHPRSCIAATSAAAQARTRTKADTTRTQNTQPDFAGSSLPAALRNMPADLRTRLKVCRWGGGWVAIPRGWHESSADIGADGGAGWTFVAPSGERGGFLSISSTPACQSCMLGGADGYFPGAHHLYVAQYGPRPRVVLTPSPDAVTHPNRCSVHVSYHIDGLEARDEAYWVPPFVADDGLVGISVALRPGQRRLMHAMLASFWGIRPPKSRYCPAHGWPSGPPAHASSTITEPLPRPDEPPLVSVPVRSTVGKVITGVHAKWPATMMSTPPQLRIAIPEALRGKVMLRHSLHGIGWSVLPRHWHLFYTHASGADGIEARVWVAPQGAGHGWLIETYGWPYTGDGTLAGNALIPGAQALIRGTGAARGAAPALTPTPVALVHPDRCTTALTYRVGGLIVKGVAHLHVDRSGHPRMHQPFAELREIFVALPPGHAKLQALIMRSFKSRLPLPDADSRHTCGMG